MPQPRVPTNLLEARGAFKKHPERARARENEPTDLPAFGECPERLNDLQRTAWAWIVERCPAGVLTSADEIAVEEMARLLERSWRDVIQPPERSLLKTYLGLFGMDPADRSKVMIPKKTPSNKFSAVS